MTDYKALYEEQLADYKELQGYKKGYERLKQENKKIKQENEKFKEDIEGDGWMKQGYKTELSNAHKQSNRMFKEMWNLKTENNKWLQVARNASCDSPEQFQEYCVRTEECVSLLTGEDCALEEEIAEIKEENYKLKEENKKIPDGVMRAFDGLRSSWMEDEERYYSENYSAHTEKYDDKPSNIPTKYLHDCNYTHLRILDDWLSKRPGHLR